MKKKLCLFFAVLIVFSLCGCEKKQTPAKKPAAEKVMPAEKAEKKEAAEVEKVEPEEYKYDVRGRRDPFLSLIEITKKKAVKKKGASPFESYDINEIKLLAIAWNKSGRHYALIMLPDKKAYTITEGMTIGLQGGKVEKITKDAVVIRELVRDYRGEVKPKESILKLHKGEEE